MRTTFGGAVCLAALVGSRAFANDAIDSKINPQNGYVETVKSEVVSSSYDVHLYLAAGLSEDPTILEVTAQANDDKSPRIEITPAGDAWIVWWRDLSSDEVHVRKFSHTSQTLGSDRVVSQAGENARNPEIVFDGTSVWVVYEVGGTGQSVIVSVIGDEPDPIPTGVTLRTTSYGGSLDARIHAEAGHLWATWIDTSTNLGWSQFEDGTWSSPSYESFSGSTPSAARSTVRSTVLAQ